MAASASPPGGWVRDSLGDAVYGQYLQALGGDHDRVLELYEWNDAVGRSMGAQLAWVEQGLRNAYDRAISAKWQGNQEWVFEARTVFPPHIRNDKDLNEASRDKLNQAVKDAAFQARPGRPTSSQVVSSTSFGFWRHMSASVREKTLWLPYLKDAFPHGTNRDNHVDRPMQRLVALRNMISHSDPLLNADLHGRLRDTQQLARRISPELGDHLDASAAIIERLIAQKPAASKAPTAQADDWLSLASPAPPALPTAMPPSTGQLSPRPVPPPAQGNGPRRP